MELVLPCAGYIVRMLDGHLATCGEVKDLRAQGVLDEIARDSAVEAQEKEEDAVAAPPDGKEPATATAFEDPAKAKKPRKLIEAEERQSGSVKWIIYKTYLSAAYVVSSVFLVDVVY